MTKELIDALEKSLHTDVQAFLPELVLCGAIVLLLLMRLVPRLDSSHLGWVALVVSVCVAWMAWLQWQGGSDFDPRSVMENKPAAISLFGGMLIFDNFAIFLKLFLYTFVPLVILLCLLTGIPDREDSADFMCLLFGSVVGMSIMASSNHLLMVFIGVEMASLPSYALAGFLKGRRQSSEAALKYVVYGGGAAGVMLYGISLVAGHYGTGYLPEIVRMTELGGYRDPVVLLGMFFVLVGIAFKLAAVPFHFWCPDVFEGAAAEVGAFLSVASKGAALALLARITLGLAGLSGDLSRAGDFTAWRHSAQYLVPVLSIFAVVTTTFGNLAAYGQTNLKRLLAYSTIAHAGFMMMGLATMTKEGTAAMLFYLITYLFMNLGAFAVVAFLRNVTGQEDLAYFRGFVYRSPLLVITLAVFLLSLLGMPPLAGFAAKFQIFTALFDAAQEYASRQQTGLSWTMYAVLLAGGLNTVVSLFYYVKVLKVMVLEKTLEEVENRPVEPIHLPVVHSSYATILALVILVLGILWNPLYDASNQGVNTFRSLPDVPANVHPVAQVGQGSEIDMEAVLLQRVIAVGRRSLLQYVAESCPWITEQTSAEFGSILAMAGEEQAAVGKLIRVLQKKHVRPLLLGSYPAHFTLMNFVTIDFLVPKLIEDAAAQIAEVEKCLASAKDEDDRAAIQVYLDLKRRHLQSLKESRTPLAA